MKTATYIENETDFEALLNTSSLLVIDCTAKWCGPCKLVAPLMDQLAEEFADQIQVFKVDLDSNPALASRFGIRSIPAVMFFKQGELMETLVGTRPYHEFSNAVSKYID